MRVIAHRSGPVSCPEQTIASAKNAINNGADMIEIDVRFTRDEALAICHDPNALRIFGVDQAIRDLTETEFLALRHQEARDYSSHMFVDYLKCGIAPLLIHIKEDEVIPKVLEMLKDYDYLDKAVLGVESLEAVKLCKKTAPQIKLLAFMPGPDTIQEFAAAGADYIRLWEGWVTPENIAVVRSTGKELWVMTCDSPESIVGVTTRENLRKFVACEVDGILINDIGELQAVLQEGRVWEEN